MFKMNRYVACIAEGAAEKAILDTLLEEHLLIFEKDRLIDEEVLNCRDAKTFETRYLRKGFDGSITVFRFLDSRRENFKLSKAYQHKVDVVNIITAPEIEMLIILNENRYTDFKKSGMKPSEFCKAELKYRNVKSYDFVADFFSSVDKLVEAIRYFEIILLSIRSTVIVKTAQGDVLHTNLPNAQHGEGDYLICSIGEDGGPDLSDVLVLN